MEEGKPVLVAAGDRIRETAKWLTVSLAALGAILIAGTQFSSIGSLDPGSPRFAAAVVGGLLAAAGTIAILAASVWTATTTPVRLANLKGDRAELKDQALLEGRNNVEELRDEYEKTVATRRIAVAANLKNPNQATADNSKAADVDAKYLSGIVQNVLQVASYYKLARTWRVASLVVGLGAVAAAVGLVLFIWAANPPAEETETLAMPAVVGAAPTASMSLSSAGRAALGPELGDGCDVARPLNVLFLSATASGADVVVQQPGCASIRVLIAPSWGVVREAAPER